MIPLIIINLGHFEHSNSIILNQALAIWNILFYLAYAGLH